MDSNKNFLKKKADTTEFDQYTCSNCNKFQMRSCPFIGQGDENPTAETRACVFFDKSYTVEINNTDYNNVSTIQQHVNLYKVYEKPENIEVAEDHNEPFSYACGQCTKFGTISCPYDEKKPESRACQTFVLKTKEGEDEIKIQNIDYSALTYDIPREDYKVHPETNSLRKFIEHPFQLKTVYPLPFRVANQGLNRFSEVKNSYARLTEESEDALNVYILDLRQLKSNPNFSVKGELVSADFYERQGYVMVWGNLTNNPNVLFQYRLNKNQEPDRVLIFTDKTTRNPISTTMLTANEKVNSVNLDFH